MTPHPVAVENFWSWSTSNPETKYMCERHVGWARVHSGGFESHTPSETKERKGGMGEDEKSSH